MSSSCLVCEAMWFCREILGSGTAFSRMRLSRFDDFLMDLKQGKRKNIRQERKKVRGLASQLTVSKTVSGDAWLSGDSCSGAGAYLCWAIGWSNARCRGVCSGRVGLLQVAGQGLKVKRLRGQDITVSAPPHPRKHSQTGAAFRVVGRARYTLVYKSSCYWALEEPLSLEGESL